MLDKDCMPVAKLCTGCEKEYIVQEDEVTCPNCGTVTLQEK